MTGSKVDEVEMTEQTLDTNSGNQNNSPAPTASQPAVSHETQAEKMLSQKEVNELVGRTKNEAYERGKRDAVATNQQPAQAQPIAPQPTAQMQSMGGMAQPTENDIDKLIDQRLAQKEQANAIRNFSMNLEQKILQGHQKYSDYDSVLRDINLPELAKTNPNFIYMLGNVDNVHDVLKDLHSNPQNLSTLMQLAQHPATQSMAMNKLQSLATSIKTNEAAAAQKTPNEPLSQIKPSTTGTDNGSLAIRDLKKQDWLRA